MTATGQIHLYMSANGIRQPIGPDDPDLLQHYERLIRDDYERCHPGESFDDLKRRARFSKEDQGLLSEWMALAVQRAASRGNDRAAA